MKKKITAYILICSAGAMVSLFVLDCERRNLHQPSPGEHHREQVQGNDRSLSAPKEYVPVFVEWTHDATIQKDVPASFQFRVHALRDLDDVVLTPTFHPMMRGQGDVGPISVGPMSAGQERTVDVVAIAGQEGEFSVGIHVSVVYQGRRLGTRRDIPFSTEMAAKAKAEFDRKLQKTQPGGGGVYVLPGRTH